MTGFCGWLKRMEKWHLCLLMHMLLDFTSLKLDFGITNVELECLFRVSVNEFVSVSMKFT